MKRKYLLLFLVLTLVLTACSHTQAPNQPETETQVEESKRSESKDEATKENAEAALSSLIESLKSVSNEDNLKKMVADKEAWKTIIPKELHNKIYYFDTFSGPEYENLAWQTLMSITVVYDKEEQKIDDETRDIAIKSMPLDEKRGHAVVPLGLYGKNLIGYYVDMIYDETSKEWKVMTYNLSNQMMLVDVIIQSTQEAAN